MTERGAAPLKRPRDNAGKNGSNFRDYRTEPDYAAAKSNGSVRRHAANLIRHAALGNAGTLISFRVGPEDAAILAKEFQPIFDVEDILNLPNRSIYLKLMIDGAPSGPFSAVTS